jgi:acetyl esterase/lipase
MAVDIYAPDGGGPWPVVVAFHGISSATRAAETNTVVAEAAAARGMVVFAPTWIVGEPFPITIDSLRSMRSSGSCALAFAQQHAAEYGGDPARTVVYGFSAGTGPALLAAVAPSTGPIPGCGSGGTPAPVAGVVLGDGEYFWHSENFDDAFRDDPSATRAELARLVDPAGWRDDVDAGFSLWAAADGTAPRSVGDPQDAAGWLAVRDPDGSIRSDLRSLGLLDDGVVTDVDSGRLLAFRLSGAGLDVTWRTYPGGHTTLDKVPEIVAELRTAAGG